MELLTDEVVLLSSNDDVIILTNHRIQMTDSVWGQSIFISIFLEDISSIEIKYKSIILFIILAGFFVLGGIVGTIQNDSGALLWGLIIGGIFFAIWWFTRKHVISISSKGGSSLNFKVQGMDDDKVNDFAHKVSLAKQKRVNLLFKL